MVPLQSRRPRLELRTNILWVSQPRGPPTPPGISPARTDPRRTDQLSIEEISTAARLIRNHAEPKKLKFNCITLHEPAKAEYAAFRAGEGPRPDRRVFSIAIEKGTGHVGEVIANLTKGTVEEWKPVKDVGPTLTLEDLDICERVCRADPRVIEVCREIGITDMSQVYFDAWAIGFDDRWGF